MPGPKIPEPSEWLLENGRDGSLLVSIPEGKVFTGGPQHFEGGCDPFWADVSAFYLALHPVTNAQYKRFIDAAGHPPPLRAATSASIWIGKSFPPELADHPVVYVTWLDAVAYCEWAGLRLPTELEWERAARGDDGRRFAWGNEWNPNNCRNDLNRGIETTSSVWSYPQGCNMWGCYQMNGNVWEWCGDSYDPNAYKRYSRGIFREPAPTRSRVTRGGSWFNVSTDSFLCGYRFKFPADDCDHHYGFRVARDC